MRTNAIFLVALTVLVPARAFAQTPSTETDVAPASTAPAVTPTAAPPPVAPPPVAAPVATAGRAPDKVTETEMADHQSVVRHVAVGYLGASQIPIAVGLVVGKGSVTAPIIGIRYWAGSRVGIDLGLGLGFSTASATQTAGAVTTSATSPAVVGLALHGGLPIALAYSKHFAFELIPEVHFGYAGTTLTGTGGAADVGLHGVRFDLGGRIGAEVQFGFIGIPQLSLQGSVGLSLRYETVWATQDPNNKASSSTLVLGTTLQNDPWAIFTNSVSALYYF